MSVYVSEMVKTRKPHRCAYCGIGIAKGDTALHEHGCYDDGVFSRYACGNCEPLLSAFWDYMGNEVYGNLQECFTDWRDDDG